MMDYTMCPCDGQLLAMCVQTKCPHGPGADKVPCQAVLNIKGEHFQCDWEAPHDGWAHGNKESQAIWASAEERAMMGSRPAL